MVLRHVTKMASLTLEEKVPKLRPPDSKNTRSPRARASSLKHKARFPTEAVKQSEESLRQLLDDFDHGRLSAFGKTRSNCNTQTI